MEQLIDNRVIVVAVEHVEKHPNADRLDIARFAGWSIVTQRGAFASGDRAVYFPIDSILPSELELELFPPESKIKLSKSRIKTIKIRGAISQGMLVPATDASIVSRCGQVFIGDDITDKLGVTKYEPPVEQTPLRMGVAKARKKHPFFPEYAKIPHFKNYPDLFEEGEQVVVTEKIHGTNFRAGWVPTQTDTWWKKIKKFFGKLPEWEFVFGSHHVSIAEKGYSNGFYPKNVYEEAVENYGLRHKIPVGFVIYGEIYGSGIQSGYSYGLPAEEHRLAIFDVLVTSERGQQVYLDWEGVEHFSKATMLPLVPVIYKGSYKPEVIEQWVQGESVLSPTQKVREGCVIKPWIETSCWMGRKFLRAINPEYLLRVESEWH
jgi:RNA ligase (TIGR02306 family)